MSKNTSNITIADISRIAGVSTSTVSHVINGTRHVNTDTKNKVLKAIEQTGYTQNFVAKSLKKSKTKTIGLIVSDFSNPFFIEVINGIEYEAYRKGYTLILSDSNDDVQREFEMVRNFYERRIDGLILSPTTFSENKTVPFLRKIDLPTVLIDRFLNIDCDWVGIENINSTKLLVNHLVKLGHQRIAIVVGLRGINTTEERISGFKAALMEAGIQYDNCIIYGDSRSKPAEKNVMEFFHNVEYQPTALVVANNLMVLGTMRALKQLNLYVPKDIALVSFDDFEWSDLFHPRLTTIAQPCFEIGVKAAEITINRIENVLTPQPQRICFEPTLIVRDSCGSNLKGE